MHQPWEVAVLFRTDSSWFRRIVEHRRQLRWFNWVSHGQCHVPNGLHGWHFSWAMDTSHILSKMRSFKGSDELEEVALALTECLL